LLAFHAEYAWLGAAEPATDVLIEVEDGRIASVTPDAAPHGTRLKGLTLPGFANAHSHAFHRALRGRTHGGTGTFWTWREQMYAVADRLDPDTYHRLARATYAEMALAGITCVGEFHYLHHAPGGTRYADPNAMGHALLTAARDVGIRITLLDTLYLQSTVDGAPLAGPQRRFGDGTVDAWRDRVAELKDADGVRIGAAAHSVRAVPEAVLGALPTDRPLHVHVSEQRAENEACQAAYGCSPTELLHRNGALGSTTTAVHATHLSTMDRRTLGVAGTAVCLCPTTERDLADGVAHAGALAQAGSPLVVGSDSNAVIDLFEETRGVELHERLASERRGHWSAGQLLTAATTVGAGSLGWPETGLLVPDALADFVSLRLDTVRLAGARPETLLESVVFAATGADVRDVVVGGRRVVAYGRHVLVDDVPGALASAIRAVLP
jgi:formiminoglutamate deiminase